MSGFKFTFRDLDRGWAKLRNLAKSMAQGSSYVKAGVLADAPRTSEDIDEADLAAIHEFGSEKAGVPERSFIRATFETRRPEYERALAEELRRVLEGKSTPEVALNRVGLRMASDMRRTITESEGLAPDAPETIEKKGSSKPLIDSGQLWRAISHAVVLRGSAEAAE